MLMKILTFVASSSTRSINKQLAFSVGRRLKSAFFTDAEVTTLDLNDFEMPLFSVDRESAEGTPEKAKRFFAEIGEADALVIAYAEHNGHYAAAYKNLFDWTSRFERKVFQNKPAFFLATSPGKGGAHRVLKSAVDSAPHFGADVVASLSVPHFNDVFDAERGLHDAELSTKLDAGRTALAQRLDPQRVAAPKKGPPPGPGMWDSRYADTFAAYGTSPNTFLRAVAGRIPKGPVLVIAAGEGRDAVHLAEMGYTVTAMDQSAVGMENTAKLAAERSVKVETVVGDLETYPMGESHWAGIVSVWAHVPPALRKMVHAQVTTALRPGGVFVLDAYAPAHLQRPGKGGPPVEAMLMTPQTVREEVAGLHCEMCQQVERDVDEGLYHQGPSTTTQVVAVRPA